MSDYISGGYYIVKAITRPPDLSESLPSNLLTMSNCFTTVVQEVIQLQWDEYDNVKEAIAEEATEFGVDESRIPELLNWAKAQHNSNYFAFSEVQPALDLFERFIRDPSARLVGIGLHTSLLGPFESQLTKDINKGIGLVELINDRRPLAEGGDILGFELLGFEATKFHSWLCHNAPDEACKRFGIRTNRLGLIDQLGDALQVNDWLVETGAEPAIWLPWLLVEYASKRIRP